MPGSNRSVTAVICGSTFRVLQWSSMQPPRICPTCGFNLGLGPYVETHCPRCGSSLRPKPPMTLGIRLLDLAITAAGTCFVLSSMFVFVFYMNSSSRAELYQGAPYHATAFRVTSIQFSPAVNTGDGSTNTTAIANGLVEGQKESMDLLPYFITVPRNQDEVTSRFPEGKVIPVYLFPTVRGANRIQPINGIPTAQGYQRQATWASNRAFPVVGLIGLVTALLGLLRFSLWRSAQRQLTDADPLRG